jgi:hypothetical protein
MANIVNVKVAAAKVNASHMDGFSAALDKALDAAAKRIGTGTYDVNVEFWATIKVTNPGQIQHYGVTLTPKG